MNKYNSYKKQLRLKDFKGRYINSIRDDKIDKEWVEKYLLGRNKLRNDAINAFFSAEFDIILENINNNDFNKAKKIINLFKDINDNNIIIQQYNIKNKILNCTKNIDEERKEKIKDLFS